MVSPCGVCRVTATLCKTHSWLHSCAYTYTHAHTCYTKALYGYPCWHAVYGLILHGCTLTGQTHTFQTASSANDVFAPSSSCLPPVTVAGVSTTTTSLCWRPLEPSRACRSSRKCRSLRTLQQRRVPAQSSKETSNSIVSPVLWLERFIPTAL